MATQPPGQVARIALERAAPAVRRAQHELDRAARAIESATDAENFGTYTLRPDVGTDAAHSFLAAARREHPGQVLKITVTAH